MHISLELLLETSQPELGMESETGGPPVLFASKQLSQVTWQPSTLQP